MADIGHEHLHHMAKRLHHITQKHDGMIAKVSNAVGRVRDSLEIGAGAWAGGVVEGKSGGKSVLGVPWNLLTGVALLAVSHVPQFSSQATHLNNVGNGFVSSYAAAVGYSFGTKWKNDGGLFPKLWGGHSLHPYELPGGGSSVQGELSEQQMASIVQRMQQAAASTQP